MKQTWIIYFGDTDDECKKVILRWEELFAGIKNANSIDSSWFYFDYFVQMASNGSSIEKHIGVLEFLKNKTENVKKALLSQQSSLQVILVGKITCNCMLNNLCSLVSILESQKSAYFGPAVNIEVNTYIQFPVSLAKESEGKITSIKNFLVKLNTLLKIPGGYSPIDKIFIFQPSNMYHGNNGFNDINTDNQIDLIGQCLLNQSINNLSWIRADAAAGNGVFSINSFSLTYDVIYHNNQMLDFLVKKVVDDFLNNEKVYHFVQDKQEVQNAIESSLIKEQYSNETLFKIIHSKFTSANKAGFNKKIYEEPNPGPYHMFFSKQLTKYFRIYIKFLPNHLVKYVKLFTTQVISNLKESLTNIEKEYFEKSENDPTIIVNIIATSHWSDKKNVIGLKQHDKVVEAVKSFVAEEQKIFSNWADKHFEKTGKDTKKSYFEVFHVPHKLRKAYDTQFAENIDKTEKDLVEKQKIIIRKMEDKVRLHPVPLALFIRLLLLGTTLMLTGVLFLRFLSDFIVNTSFFEQDSVLPFTLLFLFLLPFLFGIIRYVFLTINKLKNYRREFMILGLIIAQNKARDCIKESINRMYKRIIDHCEELLNKSNRIREKLTASQTSKPSGLIETMFQKDISNKIDEVPLLTNPLVNKYQISQQEITKEKIDDTHSKFILDKLLYTLTENTAQPNECLWKKIYDNDGKDVKEIINQNLKSTYVKNLNETIADIVLNNMSDTAFTKILSYIFPTANSGNNFVTNTYAYVHCENEMMQKLLNRFGIPHMQCSLKSIYSMISCKILLQLNHFEANLNLPDQSFVLDENNTEELIFYKALLYDDQSLYGMYRKICYFYGDITNTDVDATKVKNIWSSLESYFYAGIAGVIKNRFNSLK